MRVWREERVGGGEEEGVFRQSGDSGGVEEMGTKETSACEGPDGRLQGGDYVERESVAPDHQRGEEHAGSGALERSQVGEEEGVVRGAGSAVDVAEEEREGGEESGEGEESGGGVEGVDVEVTGGGGEDEGEEVGVQGSGVGEGRREAEREGANRIGGGEEELPPGGGRWEAKT